MDKFLEKYNLSKLNEEGENLNRPIIADKIEVVIKKLPNTQKPWTSLFHRKILQNILRRAILHRLFQNTQEEARLPKSFYKASIILIPKSDKDTTKKENYRPISLMSIIAKILNKMLTNSIQEYIEKTTHCNQVGFIPGMQGW